MRSDCGVKQANAAYCDGVWAPRKKFVARLSTASKANSGTTIHPKRQPVMPKNFEKLPHTMASGSTASADSTRLPSASTSVRAE